MPALGGVRHAQHSAVGEPDAGSALHVDEEGVDRVAEPDNFKFLAGERVRHDGGTVMMLGEAGGCLAGEAETWIEPADAARLDLDEIGGRPMERDGELRRSRQRAGDLQVRSSR